MIRGINHIGIAVQNHKEVLPYYRKLGFNVVYSELVDSQDTFIVMLDCGNVLIELVEPVSPNSPVQKFIRKYGNGKLHHICFDVDDIDDINLQKFPFIKAPTRGYLDTKIAFVHPKHTGGVLWEFVEMQRDSRLPKKEMKE